MLNINVDADIGTFEELISTEKISVGALLEAAIRAVGSDTPAGGTLSAFLGALPLGIPNLAIPLGALLNLQTGAEKAGLDTAINAFELVRAVIQVANKKHALSVDGVNVGNLVGVKVSVIEPAQVSAIGNPRLIGANPKTDNPIYVRTGQVRALASVNLKALAAITNLEIPPVIPLVSVKLLDKSLDLGLELGSAEGWVTDHQCQDGGTKNLGAKGQTALLRVTLGTLSQADKDHFFDSGSPFPKARPLNLLSAKALLGLIPVTDLKIAANLAPGANDERPTALAYSATEASSGGLPDLDQADTSQMYQKLEMERLITAQTLDIDTSELSIAGLPISLGDLLDGIVTGLLAPVLNPILNTLLGILGVNLANAELGAKMTCGDSGAMLID